MAQVIFLIDGFNLYHSTVSASRHLKLDGKGTKWLDISSLCKSLLHNVPGTNHNIEHIYYFSALATHLRLDYPEKIIRHENFIKCLEHSGITKIMGQFKLKERRYRLSENISFAVKTHEEKQTDVAISLKIVELLLINKGDLIIVLVTADTDIIPAIRMSIPLFPNAKILCAFPFDRYSKELAELLPDSFKISKEQYVNHQFPEEVTLDNGEILCKPESW